MSRILVLASVLIAAVIFSTETSEAIYFWYPDDPDEKLVESYLVPKENFYLKEVPVEEVLEKIESGKTVNYEHVIIKGDISLNQLEMPTEYIKWQMVNFNKTEWVEEFNWTTVSKNATVVKSLIRINDSIIEGNIDFNNVIFQAPNISLNNTKILGNSSFANSVFNGSAYFVNTKFNGSTSFRDSEFNKSAFFVYSTFNGSADFIGTGFDGFTSFLYSIFNGSTDFRVASFNEAAHLRSVFLDYANFKWTRFDKRADFQFSKFNNSSNFEESWFDDFASFTGSKFNEDVSFGRFNGSTFFEGSEFNGDASFGEFNGYAFFSSSKFNGNASFSGFNENTYFDEAEFNKKALFMNEYFYYWHNNFNGDTSFKESRFNGPALFYLSRFNGTADFSGSEFNSDAYFSRSQFNRSADFRGSKFEKDAIFEWSYLKSVDFNQTAISGDLSLKGSQIDSLNLTNAELSGIVLRSWKSIGHMEYDEMAYQLLLSCFRNRNLPDEANQCYYDYREGRRATQSTLRQPADYALMLFYGYGVKPERPVIWAFVFMAIFAALFWWRQGIMPVRKGEPEEEVNRFTLPEAIAFSAMTLLSGGKLVFDPPEYRIAPEKPWRDIQICKALFVWERLMGMMLLFMLAIAVTKTIILGS